ncbi:Spx/MgsR family RNA polymerase-binding regulatory protein [Phormidesmis sp. 146-35]
MTLKVYGIPTCNTCKRALKWLQENEIAFEFINTKNHPPDRAQITNWVQTLGSKPMRNTSGQSYRAISSSYPQGVADDKQTWTDDQWIAAFAQDAMLLKRPLFVRQETALLVGFPDKSEHLEKLTLKNL